MSGAAYSLWKGLAGLSPGRRLVPSEVRHPVRHCPNNFFEIKANCTICICDSNLLHPPKKKLFIHPPPIDLFSALPLFWHRRYIRSHLPSRARSRYFLLYISAMVNAPLPSPPPLPPYSTTSSSDTARPPRNRFPEKSPEALERERFILPRLPTAKPPHQPIRDFIFTRFYKLVLATIYLIYSVYLKLRWTYHTALNRGFSILYYHHRTPQLIQQDVKEVKAKGKLPKHLSVIVEYEKGGLDTLIDEVAEITCWCASAGIKHLSVYEQTGMTTSPFFTKHCIQHPYQNPQTNNPRQESSNPTSPPPTAPSPSASTATSANRAPPSACTPLHPAAS